MSKVSQVIKSYDELPLIMTAQDFINVTGLSKVTAYKCLASSDIPKIKVGKRILIAKEVFIRWIEATQISM